MATVLIIYYKQISEGYDDKSRFEILEKVGMSQKEIKKNLFTHRCSYGVLYSPCYGSNSYMLSFKYDGLIMSMFGLRNNGVCSLYSGQCGYFWNYLYHRLHDYRQNLL